MWGSSTCTISVRLFSKRDLIILKTLCTYDIYSRCNHLHFFVQNKCMSWCVGTHICVWGVFTYISSLRIMDVSMRKNKYLCVRCVYLHFFVENNGCLDAQGCSFVVLANDEGVFLDWAHIIHSLLRYNIWNCGFGYVWVSCVGPHVCCPCQQRGSFLRLSAYHTLAPTMKCIQMRVCVCKYKCAGVCVCIHECVCKIVIIYMCACVYTCMYTCTYVYMWIYMYVCILDPSIHNINIWICICISIYMHIYTYIYIYIYIWNIYIYTYIYIYIYIYIYT